MRPPLTGWRNDNTLVVSLLLLRDLVSQMVETEISRLYLVAPEINPLLCRSLLLFTTCFFVFFLLFCFKRFTRAKAR